MSQHAFLSTYGQVLRAASCIQGTADDVVREIWRLHRRHGVEVVSVVDEELGKTANLARLSKLPANSLLAMVMTPLANQPPYVDPVETESSAVDQAEEDALDYSPEQIKLALDLDHRRVVFEGATVLGGGVFAITRALMKEFEADRNAGAPAEQYRYVQSKTLAARLKISEPSLRMKIMRARQALAKAFEHGRNKIIDPYDIIQNKEWSGYRLSPHLLVVPQEYLER